MTPTTMLLTEIRNRRSQNHSFDDDPARPRDRQPAEQPGRPNLTRQLFNEQLARNRDGVRIGSEYVHKDDLRKKLKGNDDDDNLPKRKCVSRD